MATKKPRQTSKPLFLFAHGAGASSASDWMQGWAARLRKLGKVVPFDYPYMKAGRKSPDRPDKLIAAHGEALAAARKGHRGPVVLIGKSMGSRIGCHLSLEQPVDGIVCLGYPLVGMGKAGKVRDGEVLFALTTPILFVQGTRDRLCPLEVLAKVRKRMKAPHVLHVVEAGDHSLRATKTWLEEQGDSQDDVDGRVAAAIAWFVGEQVGSVDGPRTRDQRSPSTAALRGHFGGSTWG